VISWRKSPRLKIDFYFILSANTRACIVKLKISLIKFTKFTTKLIFLNPLEQAFSYCASCRCGECKLSQERGEGGVNRAPRIHHVEVLLLGFQDPPPCRGSSSGVSGSTMEVLPLVFQDPLCRGSSSGVSGSSTMGRFFFWCFRIHFVEVLLLVFQDPLCRGSSSGVSGSTMSRFFFWCFRILHGEVLLLLV